VVEIINSNFVFNSVFDIGCGMGIYIEHLKQMGKDVLGCDSSAAAQRSSKDFIIFSADATQPIFLKKKYDLVICFEVAEHIKTKHSRPLVKNCTNNSDIILFTAAPVGQGGVGHINEQPYDFWITLFEEMNFKYNTELSEKIRNSMKKENVVYWIANNFMCFSRE
jgi:2-polyprenyl-3-methyl-5-hydroxy-6-metoxy-1,4-benzoquinol methylase